MDTLTAQQNDSYRLTAERDPRQDEAVAATPMAQPNAFRQWLVVYRLVGTALWEVRVYADNELDARACVLYANREVGAEIVGVVDPVSAR